MLKYIKKCTVSSVDQLHCKNEHKSYFKTSWLHNTVVLYYALRTALRSDLLVSSPVFRRWHNILF